MYLSIRYKGRVREILRNWPVPDVRFICVSTGGRILGLGDLGANGMGIVIGKLLLYTICAAIPPGNLLPLLLDIGTTNQELLNDPLYLGLRQKPPATDELDAFVEEFVQAVQEIYPGCCIHFEDWKGVDATRLLRRYVDRVCCYNDDIQGTGAIVVAALHNALRITGQNLAAQRVLFLGAGSSALGVADMISRVMQQGGLSPEQARQHIFLFDSKGLVVDSRDDLAQSDKRPYACAYPPCSDFAAAIEMVKPTALIGMSTRAKTFDVRAIQAMSRLNERPIIFAMSNPTDHAECTAEEAYTWSSGRALFAAGVQFPPVYLNGRLFLPAQANNYHAFPALSLAVYATRARRITYRMWLEAAMAVAQQVSDEQLQRGMLLPAQADMLNAAFHTAQRVAQVIFDDGLASVPRPPDIAVWLRGMLYRPEYAR
jgi:malate dehydrogenase (oxaloacetate-decarboxylating)(NADP+)